MNILYQFTPEIISISKDNGNAPYRDAVEMFTNNIDDAGHKEDQYHYAGADHVDYASLQDKIPSRETQERNDMEDAWLKAVTDHSDVVDQLYDSGDIDGLRRFMMALDEG